MRRDCPNTNGGKRGRDNGFHARRSEMFFAERFHRYYLRRSDWSGKIYRSDWNCKKLRAVFNSDRWRGNRWIIEQNGACGKYKTRCFRENWLRLSSLRNRAARARSNWNSALDNWFIQFELRRNFNARRTILSRPHAGRIARRCPNRTRFDAGFGAKFKR